MSFDFSTLVTDRTQADVNRVKEIAEKIKNGTSSESELSEFNSAAMKGAYNHTDLNRVTAAMEDLKLRLEEYGYSVPGYQKIEVPHPEFKTSRLPEGYTELAWIESTGTQYVDTGFKPNQDTRVVMDVQVSTSSQAMIFGGRTNPNQKTYCVLVSNATSIRSDYNVSPHVSLSVANTTKRCTIDKNKNVLTVATEDGTLVGNHTYATFDAGYELTLFGVNTAGAVTLLVSAKAYACQIYDNGTLVRDFVPCINPNSEVGLYDLVTTAFFGNSGTGAFVAGVIPRELPDSYTQVEYIESSAPNYTSGQRIDTKFVPNSNTRVVCDFQFTTTTSSFQALLGSRSSSANRFCLWLTNGGVFRSDYNTSNLSFPSSLLATEKHTLDFNKNVCSIDSSVVTHSVGSFNGVCNLFLFASDTDNSADIHGNVRIYSCHIYDNGTLVRDFVSCKNASGVVGLYDMVNGVFYQNAGSGTFTAGEEIVAPTTASVMVTSGNADEYDPYTWYEFDWPTPETMTVYLLNVSAIRSVLAVMKSTPSVPVDMEKLFLQEANNIEIILSDVLRQLTIMPTTFIPAGEALCGGDNL